MRTELEEAAESKYTQGVYVINGIDICEVSRECFIEGAKYQAERMYSEEDMIAIFHYGHQIGMNSILAIQSQHSPQPIPKPDLEILKKELFEQFKK